MITESKHPLLFSDPAPDFSTAFSINCETGVIEVDGEVYDCHCLVCERLRKSVMADTKRWLAERAK